MTTLYATYRVPGDGVTTQFEFSFSGGYMDKSHVKAYIEDAVTLARTPIEVLPTMFVGDFTLNLGVAAPVGKNMVIYRDTPKSGPLVDFTTGSRLTEANLDKVAQQSVFIGAETADATNADVVAQLTTTAQAVLDAADAATAAAAAAQASEVSADTSEANALASANNAAASAASILGAVASSAANAGAAAASATIATTKAAEASASASTADTRATAAAGSANAAAASATAAAGSASTATAQATAAASSATASASSATSASASAATATTQATNAGNSASAAAVSASSASASATTATTQAGVATTQAGIATTQAGNASASATSAGTSATTATTQAGIATTQAGIATTKAGEAATSANLADTFADAANLSAIAADASAADAAAAAASVDADSLLTKAGNLSGLASPATARDNLGVEIGVDVQAFNAALASIAANNGTNSMKNRIINGAMMIDQRNAGASVNASGTPRSMFVVDRFWVASGGGTNTAQRVTGVNGFKYGIKITGASGVTQTQFGQAIESNNTADLVNQNVTLSFSAQASANYNQKFYIAFPNATDNYSGYTIIASPTFNITTSAQSFSYTFNAGANAANGIMVFASDTGFTTGFNATFSGMQLEKGSTATSFDYRQYGTELALCQRYYIGGIGEVFLQGYQLGSNAVATSLFFPVQMRSTPTVKLTTTGTINTTGSPSVVNPTVFGCRASQTISASGAFIWGATYTATAEI